jgi:hypothetical protein
MDEVIWFMKGPVIVFRSCRTLIEEILFCIMKHTFEEFVLPYVSVVIFVISTFDL